MHTCVWWWYYEMNAWARKCKRDAAVMMMMRTRRYNVWVYTCLRGVRWENSVRFSHLLTNNNNSINLKAKENKKMKLRGEMMRKKNIERMRKSMKIYLNFFSFSFLTFNLCVVWHFSYPLRQSRVLSHLMWIQKQFFPEESSSGCWHSIEK